MIGFGGSVDADGAVPRALTVDVRAAAQPLLGLVWLLVLQVHQGQEVDLAAAYQAAAPVPAVAAQQVLAAVLECDGQALSLLWKAAIALLVYRTKDAADSGHASSVFKRFLFMSTLNMSANRFWITKGTATRGRTQTVYADGLFCDVLAV